MLYYTYKYSELDDYEPGFDSYEEMLQDARDHGLSEIDVYEVDEYVFKVSNERLEEFLKAAANDEFEEHETEDYLADVTHQEIMSLRLTISEVITSWLDKYRHRDELPMDYKFLKRVKL